MKRLILFAIFFLSSVPAWSLTLSEIRTQIRRNVHDAADSTSDRRYQDDFLLSLINDAQKEVVNLTWLSEKTTEYVLTGGTSYYNLPSDFLNSIEVKFKKQGTNSRIKLDQTTRDKLNRTNVSWETQGGAPVEYWISQSTASQVTSSSTLRVSYIPVPTASSTGTVTMWFFNKVDDLASDTDIPFNAKQHLFPYHMVLAYRVTARLKVIEGRVDEATVYQNLYNDSVAIIRDRLGRLEDFRPGMGVSTSR